MFIMCFGWGLIFFDPLGLTEQGRNESWSDDWFETLWVCAIPLAIGAVGVRVFMVPRVTLTPWGVLVRNPLRSYEVPWACVTGLDVSERWPQVKTAERTISLVGAEHSMWMRFRGPKQRVTTLLREGFKRGGAGTLEEGDGLTSSVLKVRWTPLQWFEWCYVVYVSAFLVGWALRASGVWPM